MNAKLVTKKENRTRVIKIGDVPVGDNKIIIIAGPCSVESKEQLLDIADHVKKSGAKILRGGLWKPRTSPYTFRGLGEDGFEYLIAARDKYNMPIITEITNPTMVKKYEDILDCYQVGAKNMQNFDLLEELGKIRKPVLLKKGYSSTYEELLYAAEYIASGGNKDIILCERGTRTPEPMTRSTLDISAIPVLRSLTDLPIIVDPSHAAGRSDIVKDLSLAAIAAGADGLMVEVHNNPDNALCDGEQSLNYENFDSLMNGASKIATAVNRSI